MTIIQFNSLTENERNTLLSAPAWVSYLIGGADNNFDAKEIGQAQHVVRYRTTVGDPFLFEYFSIVNETFPTQLADLIEKYENLSASERTQILTEELSKLNEILAKIDSLYARALVKSLRSFAKEIAEASGGFLGLLDISYEEKHLLGLEMINYED